MSEKRTPWRAIKSTASSFPFVRFGESYRTLCINEPMGEATMSEMDDMANLIAAALDMLEILKKFVIAFPDFDDLYAEQVEPLIDAVAAIAKATGEKS